MTLIVLYYFQYSQLLDSLSLFECDSTGEFSPDGYCYLRKFPNIIRDPFSSSYKNIFIIGIFFSIFWVKFLFLFLFCSFLFSFQGVIVTLIFLLLIYKYRRDFEEEKTRYLFGFFFVNYFPERYWYELVFIARYNI